MSFFNPFRKNQRPEGVKLATMQTPEEAGTAAPHAEPTFGPRTEPSLGLSLIHISEPTRP